LIVHAVLILIHLMRVFFHHPVIKLTDNFFISNNND
jgi:hypothetical protein